MAAHISVITQKKYFIRLLASSSVGVFIIKMKINFISNIYDGGRAGLGRPVEEANGWRQK